MDSAAATASPISAERQAPPRRLSNLLLFVAALVFAMVVVGGITRLTESGLSITRWEPISGTLPPLTQADWQHAFDLYKLAFNPLRYPANLLPMTISSPAEHLDEYVGIKLNIADAS